MISILREFTKSWAFKVLMVVLVGSFIGFGGKSVFGGDMFATLFNNQNAVVTADKRMITRSDFKMEYDRLHQQYERQGNNFTNEEFVEAGQHTIMLKKMTDDAAFSAWLDKIGVKPSAKLLVSKLAAIPQFLSSVTGRFDQETYQKALAGAGFAVKGFEAQESDLIAQQQYMHAAKAGLKPPRIFATADTALTLQSRDATVFTLTPRDVPPPALPTDAQLITYYNSLKDKISRPEIRMATVVMFAPQQYMKDIAVDDAELRKAYEAQHDTLVTPETRTFVQLTAPDTGTAQKVAADLKAGQTPEAVAKKYKATLIPYSLQPKTAIADTKVGDAAFALTTGQVSDPIQGNLGIAVVKMGEIKIGSAQSFESVRESLANAYRADKAADKVHDVSTAFYEALQKGEDFDATAARLGLQVAPLPPVTVDGKVINPETGQPIVDPRTGQPADYSAYAPLLKAVFDLQKAGSASEVQSLGQGVYFAVKLVNISPAGPPPIEQIRPQLVFNWQADQVLDALTAKADEARARLAKGEAVAAVAASYKATVQTYNGLTPETAQQQKLSRPLAARLFGIQAGDVFVAQTGQLEFQVGKLDTIHQGTPAEANDRSPMIQGQLGDMVASDLMDLSNRGAAKVIKPKSNINAVLEVLNVDPPAADAKGDGSKKDSGKAGKAKS